MAAVAQRYQSFEIPIFLKLYEKDRHELLNELDRRQVMEDIYSWMQKNFFS